MKFTRILSMILCGLLIGLSAYAEQAAPAPGQKPPVLSLVKILQAPDGGEADWDKLHGKVVVLEFWATWCGPCVAAFPHLNELADQFKDKSVQFIAITAENEAVVTKFLASKPLHTWIGLDTNDATNKAYHITSIPTTVVIRPDGIIDAVTYPTQLKPENLQNLLAGKPSGLTSQPQGSMIPVGELPGDTDHSSLFQIIIRPSKEGVGTGSSSSSGGAGRGPLGYEIGRTYSRHTVLSLLPSIYDCAPEEIVVNGELPPGKFDLVVKAPQISRTDLNHLIQEVLESTFGLKSHRETRMTDVYVATAAQPATKPLKPSKSPRFSSRNVNPKLGTIAGVNQSMKEVTAFLANRLSCPVVDETTLTGRFDFDAKWDPSATPQAQAQAIGEQLGLTLTAAKRAIEVVVVEASPISEATPTTKTAP